MAGCIDGRRNASAWHGETLGVEGPERQHSEAGREHHVQHGSGAKKAAEHRIDAELRRYAIRFGVPGIGAKKTAEHDEPIDVESPCGKPRVAQRALHVDPAPTGQVGKTSPEQKSRCVHHGIGATMIAEHDETIDVELRRSATRFGAPCVHHGIGL